MKNVLFLPILILIFITCSKEKDLLIPIDLYKPSVIIVSCQASGNDTLRLVKYDYDSDKLIKVTSIQSGSVQNQTIFEYNSINQLAFEFYLTDWNKIEKTYVYNENNLIINIIYKITDYDINGEITNVSESDAPREYENSKLVKEWEYWGGFNTYEYSGDKLIKRIDYTKNGEQHHITTYKYLGDLLIAEKKENKVGGLIYLKTFKYDSKNRLVQIKDGKNIIEENDYIDKKLIEKRTYYFGIDPGYDVCYGNYIYRYKY